MDRELRRICGAEIDFALAQTRTVSSKPARAVHQCRKAIKRLRALVRLGTGDEDARGNLDRKLRDIGRLLAEARDVEVIHRTAARLAVDDELARSIAAQSARAAAAPDPAVMPEVAQRLADARHELDDYFAARGTTSVSLGASIDGTYRKTARLMQRFGERDRQSFAHDWRKGVQRYGNQLAVMADLMPERAAAELDSLDALAKCLGEFNDLSILRAALKAGHVACDPASRSALCKLAKRRQRALRKRALQLGEAVFHVPDAKPAAIHHDLEKDPHRWL